MIYSLWLRHICSYDIFSSFPFWWVFLEIKNGPIFLFAPYNCHKCIHKVSFMWQKSAYYCQIHRVICWLNDCPPGEVLLESSSSLSNLNASHAGGISVSLDLSLATPWNCLLFSLMLDLMLPVFFPGSLHHFGGDGFQKLSE